MRKKMFVLVCVGCALILFGSAMAVLDYGKLQYQATITTTFENIRVIRTSRPGGGYYFETVGSIDFEKIPPGANVGFCFVVQNTGDYTIENIDWNSTASLVSGGKITDTWTIEYHSGGGSTVWPTSLGPGTYFGGYYKISVSSDIPIASYSWEVSLVPAT